MLHNMVIKSSFISSEIIDITFPVVIAGGLDAGGNVIEIAEVLDNNTSCKVDPFSTKIFRATGINGMICGGQDYERNLLSSCWNLNPNGTWTSGHDMFKKRSDFSMTEIKKEVILIGGRTTNYVGLKQVEKYSLGKQGRWSKMNDAPKTINRHCTTMLNTSFLIVLGGSQNAQVNSNQH